MSVQQESVSVRRVSVQQESVSVRQEGERQESVRQKGVRQEGASVQQLAIVWLARLELLVRRCVESRQLVRRRWTRVWAA